MEQMILRFYEEIGSDDLEETLTSREFKSMWLRHLIRYVLYKRGYTYVEVATIEGSLLNRDPLDHSTIKNSIKFIENNIPKSKNKNE